MRRNGSLWGCLLMAAFASVLGMPAGAQGVPVPFLNGDFEQGLSGWAAEGDASLDTTAPLSGKCSLRLGPGKSAARQRIVVGGLRGLLCEANLRVVPSTAGGALRAQCFDAQDRLLLDLRQELGTAKTGRKGRRAELYFKTQAHTAYVVLSIEKDFAGPGYVCADAVSVTPDSHDRIPHVPLCDLNHFMQPLWQGDTVYAETVLLLSEGGRPATGRLLFTPTRILSVQDYAQSVTCVSGQDYILHGKTLIATHGTRMTTVRDTELPAGNFQWYKLDGKHVVVTYTHDDVWTGPTPVYKGDLMPNTLSRALFAAKKPKDFLSNPMHPNDYLGRWYAQSLVAMLDSSSSSARKMHSAESLPPSQRNPLKQHSLQGK